MIFAVADLFTLYNVVSVSQSLYVACETVFLTSSCLTKPVFV